MVRHDGHEAMFTASASGLQVTKFCSKANGSSLGKHVLSHPIAKDQAQRRRREGPGNAQLTQRSGLVTMATQGKAVR